MDFAHYRTAIFAILTLAPQGFFAAATSAGAPAIQFDMPAVTTAFDTSLPGQSREVTFDLVVSTLVVGSIDDSSAGPPPVDHLLVRCSLRDRLPVVDFVPKTELQTDYAGPISITKKSEQADSFGLNIDGAVPYVGAGRVGTDDSTKLSDQTQFQRQAPMAAVIASGTTDRGRGVYFKLRWTTQQVLEGEKHFRISFAVPASWRGGLVDVSVTANGIERSLFGSSKSKKLAEREFVIAVYQQDDPEASEIAMRLAELDRELTRYAKRHAPSGSSALTQLWRRILPSENAKQGSETSSLSPWYRGITTNQLDPYTDKRIQSLPMPVRVSVLGYTEAARELMELGETH